MQSRQMQGNRVFFVTEQTLNTIKSNKDIAKSIGWIPIDDVCDYAEPPIPCVGACDYGWVVVDKKVILNHKDFSLKCGFTNN